MNYYKRHLGDYAKDTNGLTLPEHGAFTLLLDRYYSTEHAFSIDDAMRLCRPQSEAEGEAVRYVLSKFFAVDDAGLYRNSRADVEIAKAHAKAETNREIGKRGGRPGKSRNPDETQTVSGSNPDETQTVQKNNPSHYSTTPLLQETERACASDDAPDRDQSETEGREPKPIRTAERFDEFWAEYPVKKGRAEAESKWRARSLDAIADQIIADVRTRKQRDRQWLDGYAPHGSTYVNGRGWEDAIDDRPAGQPRGSVPQQGGSRAAGRLL